MNINKIIDVGAKTAKVVINIGTSVTIAAAAGIAKKKIGNMNSKFIDGQALKIKINIGEFIAKVNEVKHNLN